MAEISEKSFPFDSEQDKMGNFDREYLADDFAEYFRAFISSGVFMDNESSLRVDANGDMTVTLNPGRLIGEGYRYTNKSNITITIDPADGVLDRIDRIAVVWSKLDRNMHYEYRVGEPSYDPAAPECRRTEEYMDYVVADIHVTAGIISITQNDIEDQRLNPQVCGLATPFMQLDTTLIFHQLQGFYEKVLAEHTAWEAAKKSEIEAWYNAIKDQLSEDAAVNLQNQITALAAKSLTLTNNLMATEPGKSALDAAVGPVIQGQIDEINSNLRDIDLENAIDISAYNGREYTPTKSGIFYAQYLPSANSNFILQFKDECRKNAGGYNISYMRTIVANQWFSIERYIGKKAFTYTAPSINTTQTNRGFFFIPFK